MSRLNRVYDILNYNKNTGLYKRGEDLKSFPSRIKIALEKIDYDAIYSENNKPLIIFKSLSQSNPALEEKIEDLYKKVWNLGAAPILFIVLDNEIRLYNSFIFERDETSAWKTITFDDNLIDNLDEFSFLNIASGKLWKKYKDNFNKEKRVDEYLLRNLRGVREELNEDGDGLDYHIINSLIGRLLFSRFLIDRKILKKEKFEQIHGSSFENLIKSKTKLYEYFDFLKRRFNGDLFPINPDEERLVHENHLNKLSNFFKGHDMANGQTVLFDVYDFSIIPIELISNIYETFLDKKKQRSAGVFYTPLPLVDYVLNNTLDEKLEQVDECKILDPACGSGVFLVESLRKLIEKKLGNSSSLNSEELRNILTNNIFGIDKDEDAIYISIFSLYLTLLDYTDNKNFRFPKLCNKNLFCSDFFDLQAPFNEKLKALNIDIIVGNPPWESKGKGSHSDYCEDKGIVIGNKQIAEAFLVRVKDFTNLNTKMSLVITSKTFYNSRSKEFREYFLEHFLVCEVLELSIIRDKLFRKAKWPGAILFYKSANNQDVNDNLVKHISVKSNLFFELFDKIVIEKYDIKHIKQGELLDSDWLWKSLLVGNSLDFYFIKRLKEDYENIGDYITKNDHLEVGVGINSTFGDGKRISDNKELNGLPYLDLDKKRLKRYYINYDSTWTRGNYPKRYNEKVLEPPNVLINFSTDANYRSIAAFSDKKILFLQTVISIKGASNDKLLLKNILALFNSKLFTYYSFLTGSIGIDINRTSKKEKMRLPFSNSLENDHTLFEQVEKLENITYELETYDQTSHECIRKLKDLECNIDNKISAHYNLTVMEEDLVDYAINISIPLIKGQQEPFEQPSKDQLKDYADIFLDHFKNSFTPQNFVAEIYDTEYFIAMSFKFLKEEPVENKQFKDEKDIEKIIGILGIQSIEKIGQIYVQRDIKEFCESSFTIIKPREKKNWHRAVAWLDVGESVNIMFKNYLKNIEEV